MEKINIFCLHGFLGLPKDWDLIKSHFMVSSLARNFNWYPVDYMNTPGLSPQSCFEDWARNFNLKVRAQVESGPCILVGYSLGGRLALHALKDNPELFDRAIFISTNPGLQREKEKQDRRTNDLLWEKKFLESPWTELMKDWNAQNVFKDSLSEPRREETDYNRRQLAHALKEWSLCRQEDFRNFISQQSEKILWLSGEKDLRYASISMDLKKRAPNLRTEILRNASHRILFDLPGELSQKMISFILRDFEAS